MNKKIVGIVICMLFIVSALIPIVSGMVDQQQSNTSNKVWLENGVPHWQQFVNQGRTLQKVELHFGQWYQGSADITLSIEESLGAPPITKVTYPASYFTYNLQTWYTFDVPDVSLTQGNMYYIVLRFGSSSEYAWSGDTGDPYPSGSSSHTDPQWDYAFRTIVDRSRSMNLPFFNFLQQYPILYQLFQRFLKI